MINERQRLVDVTKKSDRRLAALSGLAILLVVAGHATAANPESAALIAARIPVYAAFLRLIEWIYTFHMPLFFVVSGLVYCRFTSKKEQTSYGTFIASKARLLLLPYFIISSIAFPIKAELSEIAVRPAQLSLNAYIESLLIPWDNPIIYFWFLPTLFLCFLPAPLLLRKQQRLIEQLLILAALILLWIAIPHTNRSGFLAFMNMGGALHNLVFFFLGIMIQQYNLAERVQRAGWGSLLLLAASVTMFLVLPSYPWLRLPLAFAGVGCCFLFVRSLPERFRTPLATVGDYSFPIYLLSWFPIILIRLLTTTMPADAIFVGVLLSILSGALLPILVARLFIRYAPKQIGQIIGAR